MKGYHDSKTPVLIRDSWRTPKWLFDYYNRRFDFDMDAASSHESALCEEYLTEADNALSVQWGYSVWLNPPYSNIPEWTTKAIEEFKGGSKIVMLLPADTSVKWFKLAFQNCTECHFITGRVSFISEKTNEPVSGNNKGSVVFVFDPLSPFKSQTVLLDRDEMKASVLCQSK